MPVKPARRLLLSVVPALIKDKYMRDLVKLAAKYRRYSQSRKGRATRRAREKMPKAVRAQKRRNYLVGLRQKVKQEQLFRDWFIANLAPQQ